MRQTYYSVNQSVLIVLHVFGEYNFLHLDLYYIVFSLVVIKLG